MTLRSLFNISQWKHDTDYSVEVVSFNNLSLTIFDRKGKRWEWLSRICSFQNNQVNKCKKNLAT
jgi:hypothetical protein